MTDTEKVVTIRYKELDILLNREEAMIQTMKNYLNRNEEYEFIENSITFDKGIYKLNLKIRLKN